MFQSTTITTTKRLRLHWRDYARIWWARPLVTIPIGAALLAFIGLLLPIGIVADLIAFTIGLLIIACVAALIGGCYALWWLYREFIRTAAAYRSLQGEITYMSRRGIYLIWCAQESASYLGSTEINFHVRWGQHITQLDRNEHHNPRLQAAWNTYGRDAFDFIAIEPIEDIASIRPRELTHLEWRALNLPVKYNYNVNNSRARTATSLPELQFVYPTRIVQASAPQHRIKRKSGRKIKP